MHAVIFEKAAGRKGRGPQDADPAYFFRTHQRAQAEVQPNSRAHRQQGAEKLPHGQAEKNRLRILPDFLLIVFKGTKVD